MTKAFEVLDQQQTPLGPLVLRRRLEPSLQVDLYEVKLGEEFLMSSLYTVGEEQLAHLTLDMLTSADAPFDVAVGGLGLGYTAAAALEHPEVGSLNIIEALAPVIDWHVRGLVPLGPRLTSDSRCRFHQADFFSVAAGPPPLVPNGPTRYDAVIVDIDHTPAHHLHDSHAGFYTDAALRALATHLRPGGVFGLWSDAAPDAPFVELLASVFRDVNAHVVRFRNPISGESAANTVYVARSRA